MDTSPFEFVTMTFLFPGAAVEGTLILMKITPFWNTRLLRLTPVPDTDTDVVFESPVPASNNCLFAPLAIVAVAGAYAIGIPGSPTPIAVKLSPAAGAGT
jgi:hypothetical protein